MFIILAIPLALVGAFMWFKGTDDVPELLPMHCKAFIGERDIDPRTADRK